MKLAQVIAALAERDTQSQADIDDFLEYFSIEPLGWDARFDARVHAKYFESWLCTDTYVGQAIVYFDNEPLALTAKTARRNTTDIHFIHRPDLEARLLKFKDFLLSLHDTKETKIEVVGVDPEAEMSISNTWFARLPNYTVLEGLT